MSDNSDRSDSERSSSESEVSDSEYSSHFSSEDDGSDVETPADSPENVVKDSRPPVKVKDFDNNVPPMSDVQARRKQLIKPYKSKRKEVNKLNNDFEDSVNSIEELRTKIVGSLAALLTLSDQERFFYELLTNKDNPIPYEPDLKYLLKIPERETEKTLKSVDESLNSIDSSHLSLKNLMDSRFRTILLFMKRIMPDVYDNISQLTNEYPEKLQSLVEAIDNETKDLEPANKEEIMQQFNDVVSEFKKDLARFEELQEKYPSLKPNSGKYETTESLVNGFKDMVRRIDKISLELVDVKSFGKYLLKKNPKQEYLLNEEKNKNFEEQQRCRDKKLDLMDFVDDGYVDIAVIEKKIFRIRTLVERYKKEQMILDKGVDDQGIQVVNISQDLLDRMKEDIISAEKQAKELEDELKKIKLQGEELEKERQELEDELKEDETEYKTAPIIVNNATQVNQTAWDIKLLKKECQRLGDLEKLYGQYKKDADDLIASEKNETENVIQSHHEKFKKELDEFNEKINELLSEANLLPPFPDSAEIFREQADKLIQKIEKIKVDMNNSVEKHDKMVADIDDLESKLDKYTGDYDKHIRVEFDEPLLKDYKKDYSSIDKDNIKFLENQAHERARECLNTVKTMSEEERTAFMTEVNEFNEKSFLESIKMNEVLLFLNEATPEDKRKFYTREADRRVRFTKHSVDRFKELYNLAQKMSNSHSKTDETLSNRYDAVTEWISNIEKKIKSQEEKNNLMFEHFLNRLPVIKKQAAERKDTIAEIDEKVEEIEAFDKSFKEMDEEENHILLSFGECSEEQLEEAQFKNVELQLEVDKLTAKSDELDLLIEREEKRLKELEEKESTRLEAQRKMEKKLRKAENRLVAAKNKQEERAKIEQYGSIDEMLKAETKRLKDLTTCSNCMVEPKSAIITKCCHIFCLKCIDSLVKSRNRKCPKCKMGFGANDYQRVYLGNLDV